jgi:PsbP-like protein
LGIVIVMLICFFFRYGSAFAQTTNNNFITYNNPNLGIKIQYPADWIKEEKDFGLAKNVLFLAPDSPIKYAEKLFIAVLDENRSSLTDIVNDEINFYKYQNDAIANYQVIESTPIVVNNIPAYKIVDTYTDPNKFGNVKTMDILVLKGNKLYELQFTSEPEKYDILLPTVQRMIDSFQITTN